MLQIILIVIASIVGIIILLGLIMPKQYSIASEILINCTQQEAFNYVKLLRNQEKYSKWVMEDPNVKLAYNGTDGTVGFTASWNSQMKNVGVGEQEIIKITEGVGYDVEIRFEKPFKGTNYANVKAEASANNQTKVTTPSMQKHLSQ